MLQRRVYRHPCHAAGSQQPWAPPPRSQPARHKPGNFPEYRLSFSSDHSVRISLLWQQRNPRRTWTPSGGNGPAPGSRLSPTPVQPEPGQHPHRAHAARGERLAIAPERDAGHSEPAPPPQTGGLPHRRAPESPPEPHQKDFDYYGNHRAPLENSSRSAEGQPFFLWFNRRIPTGTTRQARGSPRPWPSCAEFLADTPKHARIWPLYYDKSGASTANAAKSSRSSKQMASRQCARQSYHGQRQCPSCAKATL